MPNPNAALPPLGSTDRASFLARMIAELRGPNPQPAIDGLWYSHFGPPLYSAFVPSSPRCPAWYFVKTLNQAAVIVDGTTTLAQVRGQVDGFSSNLLANRPDVFNPWFRNAGKSIIAYLSTRGVTLPGHVALAGWSAGGAIVAVLPGLAETKAAYGNSWSIDTFGAPRAYGRNDAGTAEATSRMMRWMNNNDPVPMVPPHTSEYLAAIALFGLHGSQIANAFVHAGSGHSIAPNGTMVVADLPTTARPNFGGSLANWLEGLNGVQDIEHSINVYASRLEDATILSGGRVVRFAPHIEIPEHAPVHTNNARARDLNTAIVALETRQNARPVSVPTPWRFRAIRLSRIWFVYWGLTQVAMPGTRKAARQLARTGNQFLNSMQTKAVVDQQGMATAVTSYMTAAQDAALGFTPAMNVTMPEVG